MVGKRVVNPYVSVCRAMKTSKSVEEGRWRVGVPGFEVVVAF
jgi:hypothetical protein